MSCSVGSQTPPLKSLLMTCSPGNCEKLRYLITSGIDINQIHVNGNTALHCCVSCGQLECVKILVENGARLDINYKDVTPVQLASIDERMDEDITEYFVQSPSCTRAAKIEALELLGVKCMDNFNDYLEGAQCYWLRSLEERGRAEPGDNIPPKRDEPHPAFGNMREFQTEEELGTIASSFYAMYMQCLIITERILGPVNSYTSNLVTWRAIYYGCVKRKFDRGISLMTYLLDMEEKSEGASLSSWKEFCSVNNETIECEISGLDMGPPVKYKDVMVVLTMTVDIFERAMKPHLDQPWNYATDSSSALYEVVRSISILSQLQTSASEDDRLQFRTVLRRFVRLNVRDEEGRTPLHWACIGSKMPYSPLDVVQLLLEAGEDPQAVSLNRDTPLHFVAKNKLQTQHQIIKLLLSSGTHYDASNADGQCFTELLDSDNVFKVDNLMDHVSLQCLSAKAVKRHGIPYEAIVPTRLIPFVKMH